MEDEPGWETMWVWESGDRHRSFKTEAEGLAWLKENPDGVLHKERWGPLRPPGSADKYGVPRG